MKRNFTTLARDIIVCSAASATMLLAGTANAQPAPSAEILADPDATAQGDVSVTIYNNNLALVQDIRQLPIRRGTHSVAFPDVSAQIRPETLSFNADGTTIIEQNFDFDLLTPAKLIEKAIGQTVTLVRTNVATGEERRERATVLSTAGGTIVKIGDRIEVLRDDGLPTRVIFDQVPRNLRARPTLSVTLQSDAAGTRPASIRYLTPGLGWGADYVALYDEVRGVVDMQGWVTLTNNTGTTFHRADTLLVAGSVGNNTRRDNNRNMRRAGTETADRERLGEFYLYPIAGRTTIANAQTKQVSFLDMQAVPAAKVYARSVGWLTSDPRPVNVASEIAFSSSAQGGLGDALPAGAVRFYQRDVQGNPQFIGENTIGHTPMGSTLSLKTGDAFDVLVQAEVEKREEISAAEWRKSARYRVVKDGEIVEEGMVERPVDYYRTTMRYTFTNAKPQPVDVELTQAGLDRGWWSRDYRIVSEDVEGEQINSGSRKYVVRVPANGRREVRVTYETRY
ncbi:hypothetical protein HME9302_01421 [Alteripontixanthobacter maritimus]|uniref:DUF4139 domain-containing protein n=1 Tax=Alteripontixanthobacter maritimus TaxID=2161824 RepID=A0A369Q743_9SPHN|nr:DUF4139 domain-containing protein [Alteripontixanthobacter maritimus]RDC60220.1 hypothetical protein HME9302_01421 [Alteripontixanthobacter maritimus]